MNPDSIHLKVRYLIPCQAPDNDFLCVHRPGKSKKRTLKRSGDIALRVLTSQ